MVLVRRTQPARWSGRWGASPPSWTDVADLVDRMWSDTGGARASVGAFPPVNVTQDDDRYYVRAELPGIDAAALDVAVERNKLTLKGERRIEAQEGVSYHRRERAGGVFARTVILPGEPDPDGVTAAYTNGVLTVALPKSRSQQRRQIAVDTD